MYVCWDNGGVGCERWGVLRAEGGDRLCYADETVEHTRVWHLFEFRDIGMWRCGVKCLCTLLGSAYLPRISGENVWTFTFRTFSFFTPSFPIQRCMERSRASPKLTYVELHVVVVFIVITVRTVLSLFYI